MYENRFFFSRISDTIVVWQVDVKCSPLSATMVCLSQLRWHLLREEGVAQQEDSGCHQHADWHHLPPHCTPIRVDPTAFRGREG